ncbi:MAG: AAA family ATPase [bacterium]
MAKDFLECTEGTRIDLPAHGALPAAVHVFDAESVHAINAALAAERPLLVRGEPGTGKSQLARAAAVALKGGYRSKVIDARTEVQDLFFTFDAVARLAEAQLQGALRSAKLQVQRRAARRAELSRPRSALVGLRLGFCGSTSPPRGRPSPAVTERRHRSASRGAAR